MEPLEELLVVDIKTGKVASALKCFVRNLTIAIWPIEAIVVLISPSRRIGDYLAGTRVELMTDERNSKPKIDFINVAISLFLGFIILFAGSFLLKDKLSFGNGAFDSPAYVSTSYNKDLSLQLENQINQTQDKYLLHADIKVYDKITNDSLKFVVASFDLKEDYIDDSSFEDIKAEIFKSMYGIIPKDKLLLVVLMLLQVSLLMLQQQDILTTLTHSNLGIQILGNRKCM